MRDYWGYEGKVCVVTGASSGMGKAAAEMLVDLGASVYAIARRDVQIPGLAASIQADLSDRRSIDDAFQRLPDSIDAFFGIAGATGHSCDYITTYATNFLSNQYMAEQYLKKSIPENGSVTFVTSSAGLRWENPIHQQDYLPVVQANDWDKAVQLLLDRGCNSLHGKLAYAPSKRALNYYTTLLATELGQRHIRVNAVLPGSTDTGMTADFVASLGSVERLISYGGLAGRLATPQEMAGPVVFLGSQMASYISGICLVADYALEAQIAMGQKPDSNLPPQGSPSSGF